MSSSYSSKGSGGRSNTTGAATTGSSSSSHHTSKNSSAVKVTSGSGNPSSSPSAGGKASSAAASKSVKPSSQVTKQQASATTGGSQPPSQSRSQGSSGNALTASNAATTVDLPTLNPDCAKFEAANYDAEVTRAREAVLDDVLTKDANVSNAIRKHIASIIVGSSGGSDSVSLADSQNSRLAVATLRQLNRLLQHKLKAERDASSAARQKAGLKHLQLENLVCAYLLSYCL